MNLAIKLALAEIVTDWARPGDIYFHVIGETDMALQFEVLLPSPGASDVVTRELSVTIGDAGLKVMQLPGIASSYKDEGPQDATVTVSLVDIDDVGNRSPARERTAVLTDTIAPPQPGELAINVTGET